MTKAVFADTNVLLSFYEVSAARIEDLQKMLFLQKEQDFRFYTTDHIKQEFDRRRNSVIAESLKRFNQVTLPAPPVMSSSLQQHSTYVEARAKFNDAHRTLKASLLDSAVKRNLQADKLITNFFKEAISLPFDPGVRDRASIRVALGNPPGKRNELGDAVNWECILSKTYHDIRAFVLITDDVDYKDSLVANSIDPFLESEWRKANPNIPLEYYKTLEDFSKENLPDLKEDLFEEVNEKINALAGSANFQATHSAIANLATVSFFTARQANYLVDILDNNNQVSWIFSDHDVRQFYERIWSECGDKLQYTHRDYLKEMLAYNGEGEFPVLIPF